ncbi:Condensin-2 complex subunit G2 [Cocos nucifera]|uniref:Condensin-2 complex subunit G2 n=1 Tax=Cocos nucifera TaxID=13894 RepID=A0A8K0N3X3_COCNU|nr:Condensin-2 complex subunit G2 [Cocos nucifera]
MPMEKRLRSSSSSSPSSAEDLLSSAPSLPKSALKSLIFSISPSSPLSSTLPPALLLSVSRSLAAFKSSLHSSSPSAASRPSLSPPSKRSRRSSRHRRSPAAGHAASSTEADHLENLRAYAYVAHLCISHPKKLFSPADLLPAAQSLHDGLVLYEMDSALLSQVAALCEEWWKAKLPGSENLIPQSLPFLLSRSLTQGKKADVRRVCALRDAFSLFDYMDESIEDLRLLLVRCVITPVYLKTEEGRRFVAFMLGLNGQLTKEALSLMRSQIPFGKKSVLEAYADILFRGWKGLDDSLREEIEDGFLQGLVEGAIHASSKSFAASIRRVLGGFIEQRATAGVEKLLFRLVEPLLFRSLQVANSNVRQNALHLLLDMFPLEDPDVTKEVKDALLDKQFFLLDKLLLDDCPEVRTVAVEGSCRILNLYWEVIPSSMITKFLANIIDNMSHDMCNEVVSLDALLSSLANDHPRVAQKITRLLIPSYFPSKLNLKEACSRCISLIKRSPTAGARFCEFAVLEGSSSKSLLELLRISTSLALSPKGLDLDQIDGLLIASANICQSLSSELSGKATLNQLLSTEKLKGLFAAASSEHAQAALLSIASVVSLDNLVGLHDHCMAIIVNSAGLSDNLQKQELVQAAHKLMFSCGWFDELFEVLTNKLQVIASKFLNKFGLEAVSYMKKKKANVLLKTSTGTSCANAKGSSNSVMSIFEEEFSVAAAAAWQVKKLLTSDDTRNDMLKSPNLEMAFSALRIISQVCIEQCVHRELFDIAPVLAYTAFALYMSLQNVDSTVNSNLCHENSLRQTSISPEVLLDNSLKHLLNCADKLFRESANENSSDQPSKFNHEEKVAVRHKSKRKAALSNRTKGDELKTDIPEARRLQNMMKLVTSILQFIVDAATMSLVNQNQGRWVMFASSYARYVVSAIGRHRQQNAPLKEDDLKEMLTYLKSSFTYATKLLHLVLRNSSETSAPPPEAFYLANDLLDLVTSIESYLGLRYAFHVVSVAKPWLPVLILGLGCNQLIKVTEKGGTSNLGDIIGLNFPVWLSVLGKTELYAVNEISQDVEGNHPPALELSVFRKLIEMLVILLKKGSPKILDAVGCVFLAGLEVGLDKADFDLVLGLVHFTCVKLLDKENACLEELQLMSSSLHEIHLKIERNLQGHHSIDDGKHQLESARTLIRSVLTHSR